jgi:lysophospholipase L1-like esterase
VVVVNTGNVPLTNVNVSDSEHGFVALNQTTLVPGEVAVGNYSMAWIAGQQVSVASVAGAYDGGNFTDSDSAYYFGFSSQNPVDVPRVACVGDSITSGSNYTVDLYYMLGFRKYSVSNFGVSGAAILLNTKKPYLNQTEFQNVKSFLPNIVVIMLGTNDANTGISFSNDKFVADYTLLINELQALSSKPKIFLVKPPPIYDNTLSLSNTNLREEVIPGIEQVAAQLGLPTIDVYTSMLNHPEYFFDGVHPNNDGSRIIANEIYEAIISSSESPS